MKDWDVGRIESLCAEVRQKMVELETHFQAFRLGILGVLDLIRLVDDVFRPLRVVKALLVRERKSRA